MLICSSFLTDFSLTQNPLNAARWPLSEVHIFSSPCCIDLALALSFVATSSIVDPVLATQDFRLLVHHLRVCGKSSCWCSAGHEGMTTIPSHTSGFIPNHRNGHSVGLIKALSHVLQAEVFRDALGAFAKSRPGAEALQTAS